MKKAASTIVTESAKPSTLHNTYNIRSILFFIDIDSFLDPYSDTEFMHSNIPSMKQICINASNIHADLN